jgi:hypothetical protein
MSICNLLKWLIAAMKGSGHPDSPVLASFQDHQYLLLHSQSPAFFENHIHRASVSFKLICTATLALLTKKIAFWLDRANISLSPGVFTACLCVMFEPIGQNCSFNL